jgi:hypothetical protein
MAHNRPAMAKLLTYTNPITIPVFPAYGFRVDLTHVQSLDGFSHLNFAIIVNPPALFPLHARVLMGVLSANPLAAQIDNFPVQGFLDRIRTYAVTGPEFSIQLLGDPGATYAINAWVYLN